MVPLKKNGSKTTPRKLEAAHAKQQEQVSERLNRVREACESLVNQGAMITKALVSAESDIPVKTLERSPYKELINEYSHPMNKIQDSVDPKVEMYRRETEYWREIALRYKQENSNLMRLLVERGIGPPRARDGK